jgi:hypothetical protein
LSKISTREKIIYNKIHIKSENSIEIQFYNTKKYLHQLSGKGVRFSRVNILKTAKIYPKEFNHFADTS